MTLFDVEIQGTCCSDNRCCPHNYKCDSKHKICVANGKMEPMKIVVANQDKTNDVSNVRECL